MDAIRAEMIKIEIENLAGLAPSGELKLWRVNCKKWENNQHLAEGKIGV